MICGVRYVLPDVKGCRPMNFFSAADAGVSGLQHISTILVGC